MVFKDDPDHLRLRSLANKAFTPKRVQEISGLVQHVVDELVDALAAREGPVDLVADLAIPLPLRVISEMLGVGQDDRERFQISPIRPRNTADGNNPANSSHS